MARRRGNSEGSIFKRADGRWCALIDLGWESGKRKRKSLYGTARKEVADKLTEALRDKKQGFPMVVEHQTVGQFLERWLEESVKPSVRPLTYQQYHQHVRLYLAPRHENGRHLPAPALGSLTLSKLRPEHVQHLMNMKLESGLSPRTVQLSLVILRRAIDQALKWGLIGRNVAKLVDSPKVKRFEMKPLTQEQARRFLDAAIRERLEALYSVALALGLRQGEALALRWQDVDFEARAISVRQTLERIRGKRIRTVQQSSIRRA